MTTKVTIWNYNDTIKTVIQISVVSSGHVARLGHHVKQLTSRKWQIFRVKLIVWQVWKLNYHAGHQKTLGDLGARLIVIFTNKSIFKTVANCFNSTKVKWFVKKHGLYWVTSWKIIQLHFLHLICWPPRLKTWKWNIDLCKMFAELTKLLHNRKSSLTLVA